MPRSPIPPKVRWEVLARDGFRCRYCGAMGGDVVLVVDHHRPVSQGGGNQMFNLITACEECNQGKSDSELPTFPEMTLLRHAAQVAAYWLRWAFYDFLPEGHAPVQIPDRDLMEVVRYSPSYDDALETLMLVAEKYNEGYFGEGRWGGMGANGASPVACLSSLARWRAMLWDEHPPEESPEEHLANFWAPEQEWDVPY